MAAFEEEEDRRTVHAKPFPKSTTEERVRELFAPYGSICRVKLRREPATNTFRGSVYVEFAEAASADAAVASPPQQLHAAARLQVMLKTDYERRRAQANTSAGGQHSLSAGHKRARVSEPSSQPPHQSTPVSGEPQQQQEQQQWQQLAEEREAQVKSLEEQLRREKEDNQRLYQRLAEAQQRAQEASAREATANAKVLSREVEIGALKGEIAVLKTQTATQVVQTAAGFKARISELEASVQRLKDAAMERDREGKRGAGNGTGNGKAGRAAGGVKSDDLDDL